MKASRFFFILCGLTLITTAAIAQPDSLWSRTYGSNGSDRCYDFQRTTDGGYILAGNTTSYGSGGRDFWLVKTDSVGTELWNRAYGGEDSDYCYSVQEASDGGYVLAGYTNSFGAGDYDFWLVKTDRGGDSLWSRTFGGTAIEYCYSVRETSDGGFILAGESGLTGGSEVWLVKTNANGDSLWGRTFDHSATDACHSIQLTPDGGYILAGYTGVINPEFPMDFWLVKTDSLGDTLWTRTFGGNSDDYGYCVQLTSDGGYILAGNIGGDFGLIKTDSNGDSLWGRVFGGADLDACYYVAQTSDDGYILGGYTESFGAGDKDAWLLRTDANGDSLWSRTFGGSGLEECHAIEQTSDGGYIFAGRTRSFGMGVCDFWLVKTGQEPSAAELSLTPLPIEYTLHQNYPNPFNPTTRISYDLTKASHVSLKIFDLLGREVRVLVNDVQSTGTHSITFDGSSLPSGIYFYHLQAGDFITAKKMLLLK